jgi:hypothetical protein
MRSASRALPGLNPLALQRVTGVLRVRELAGRSGRGSELDARQEQLNPRTVIRRLELGRPPPHLSSATELMPMHSRDCVGQIGVHPDSSGLRFALLLPAVTRNLRQRRHPHHLI